MIQKSVYQFINFYKDLKFGLFDNLKIVIFYFYTTLNCIYYNNFYEINIIIIN